MLSNVILPIDRSILSDNVIYAIARGGYEKTEAKAATDLIHSEDRILELGGGLGLISTISARIAKGGKVVAVEANAKILDYMRRVHELNDVHVTRINAVVTGVPRPKTMKFFLRKDFWTSSLSDYPKNFIRSVDVDVIDINSLVVEHKPTVLICDIEGGEINLLVGDWTRGIRLVIMEVHEDQLGVQGIDRIKAYFRSAGFDVTLDTALMLARRHPVTLN